MIENIPEFLYAGIKKPMFVYELLDPRSNTRFYVGQTNNLKRRYSDHKNSYKRYKHKTSRYINDLRKNNILPIMRVISVTNNNHINEAESMEIKKCIMNTTNIKLGSRHSRGHKLSYEHKRKISIAHKGKQRSVEHCKNLSKSLKGKVPSKKCQEAAKKWRLQNPNVLPKNSCKVLCVETSTIYPSISKAAKDLKLQKSKVSLVCNKKRKSTGGYHFIKIGVNDAL